MSYKKLEESIIVGDWGCLGGALIENDTELKIYGSDGSFIVDEDGNITNIDGINNKN